MGRHASVAASRRMRRLRVASGAAIAGILAVGIIPSVSAGAAAAPQFSVVGGVNRPATGSPTPASGMQAALWGNASSATTTITGSGRLIIGAIGQYCLGWPTVRTYVDGKQVGTSVISSATNYGAYYATTAVGSGTHSVKISFIDDAYVAGQCDRNVYIGSAKMEFANAQLAPATGGQPGPTNTGVPAGTALTVHNGDLDITTPGTVIDAMDINGFVRIKANNVTIKRSIIRGGIGSASNTALVQAWWPVAGLLIQDSTLLAAHPSYWTDGLKGHNFTANRVNISNVVDTVQLVNGGSATITNSWLHGNTHYTVDPLQADGKSHDDNIQIQGGSGTVIRGNTLEGANNSAIMVTQGQSKVSNLTVDGNWLAGGACTINVSQYGAGTPILGMSVTYNRFGTQRINKCAVIFPATSPVYVNGNTWLSDGSPVKASRG